MPDDKETEIMLLRALVLALAERLANASEVLGMLAEKREARNLNSEVFAWKKEN